MVVFYLMGFVCLIVILERSLLQSRLIKPTGVAGAGLVFVLIGLRIFMQVLHLPTSLYELPLFSPSIYGSSIITPSLGDLFINTSLALYLFLLFKHRFGAITFKSANGKPWGFLIKTAMIYCGLLLSVFISNHSALSD